VALIFPEFCLILIWFNSDLLVTALWICVFGNYNGTDIHKAARHESESGLRSITVLCGYVSLGGGTLRSAHALQIWQVTHFTHSFPPFANNEPPKRHRTASLTKRTFTCVCYRHSRKQLTEWKSFKILFVWATIKNRFCWPNVRALKTKNSVAWVRERTIPTERPPLVG
jgi:hypothetical protein